ncbi:cold shock domain-containing protein [Neisseria sp. CCUG12390]|uniref:cold shock domain-containing protein n=1 Tax=Neisseria sp. CCUG12390 TaxID=3392035 RepID=UPI003A0FFF63
MRYLGKIVRWNDERGFGFIKDVQTDKEYFVHISEFAVQQPRPQENEEVSFTLIKGNQGKLAAGAVEYVRRPQAQVKRTVRGKKRTSANVSVLPLACIGILLLAFGGYFVFQQWQDRKAASVKTSSVAEVAEKMKQERKMEKEPPRQQVMQIPQEVVDAANERAKNMVLTEKASHYRCDGRKYCSQMTSCEEAEFFLENCGGAVQMEMDGDRDGIPCERQWCGH